MPLDGSPCAVVSMITSEFCHLVGGTVTQDTAEASQPLTVLAEDELIFRDSIREFAEAQVKPLVREMDDHAKIPRALIDKLFDLGVMGIEVQIGRAHV